jgi:CrcB protein
MSFYQYILVGFGGALGAILRVGISRALPPLFANIPSSILIINVLGGLLIGIISEWSFYFDIKTADNVKLLCVSGLLGGFTTFSTFTLEITQLIEKEKYLYAIAYILLSVFLSLIFFYMGTKIIKLSHKC